MNKLPGKTLYSGRRRTVTRASGFKSHPDSTGGEFRLGTGQTFQLPKNAKLTLKFEFPADTEDHFSAFGIYFCDHGNVDIQVENPNSTKLTLERSPAPDWSKIGSIWKSSQGQKPVTITFISTRNTKVDLYQPSCGVVWHEFYAEARPAIMTNLHQFSPEANFYENEGEITWVGEEYLTNDEPKIPLKTCNRCARFLPINLRDERKTLSFSNHCIAKAPCQHKGFGLLKDQDNPGRFVKIHYGFQLECRVCKKFAVNGALNPQRTSDQMKEDGQRRRHFELLISELYQMSPQLAYRHKTGRELTNDIWNKFDKKCFKCEAELPTPNSMALDHTRPLALLWQLDETATALCPHCNSQKRDRSPIDFYTADELKRLSKITGLGLKELMAPSPNEAVLKALIKNVDWLMKKFLTRSDIQKDRDGKVAAELICKALDKVVGRSSFAGTISFVDIYKKNFH